MPLVAIADCDHGTIAPERELLEAHGVEVREGVHDAADVLIVQYTTVDAALLDGLPGCRAVIRYGVGVDTVDVDAATGRGVWVVNVPDYGTEEVADHTVALMLALLRGVAVLDRSVHGGGWDHRAGPEPRRLSTLALGLFGRGRIGEAVGRRAQAFGMTVRAHDPALAESVPLAELLAASDVVSLHAPLTDATRHAVDPRRMRRGSYLVNTSRGGLVDAAAVLAALGDGTLAGAALDVFEHEPPEGVEAELARHERVIATPHAAWWSRESLHALKTEVAREALRVLGGEDPRAPVNADALRRRIAP
jgi:D-3-phosphoglycerate dehydrogenase